MKDHPVKKRDNSPPAPRPRGQATSRAAALGLVLVIVAGLGFLAWRMKQTQASVPTAPDSIPSATNAPTTLAGAKPQFEKLKGKWLRPDGGYVLEIRSMDSSGKLEAAYFNPRPINVARAQALSEGAATKVFVELRDVNYPGSTYTLVYDARTDRLQGLYFQALERQTFEVEFIRQ